MSKTFYLNIFNYNKCKLIILIKINYILFYINFIDLFI